MTDYQSTQLLTTFINIEARNIKGNINELLFKYLKKKYEGVCNTDGYVKKNSLEIVNRSIGEVKTINSVSYVVYNITYKAIILSPIKGVQLNIVIDSITKMGIIGYLKEDDSDTIENSPFIVIIPGEYFEEGYSEKYKINDTLNIIIEASRIKYLSKHIQVVGKPV